MQAVEYPNPARRQRRGAAQPQARLLLLAAFAAPSPDCHNADVRIVAFAASVHSPDAPFFNSAGQLTITSNGCDPAAGVDTRNRLPSGATAKG